MPPQSAEGTADLIGALRQLVAQLAPALGVSGDATSRAATRVADQLENAVLSVATKV